ncbi:MAG: peroxiredoxin [Geminicoccales bacterium]
MTIDVGQKIPNVELFILEDGGPKAVSTDALFGGKRVALFGVPGAFTRTCSAKHLPGFVQHADALKAAGIDEVMCLSTNDVFVLDAWGRAHDADGKVVMVSDGLLSFTRAAGLEVMLRDNGFGQRCRRFSTIVDNGVVASFHTEKPGEFGETSAETLLGGLSGA